MELLSLCIQVGENENQRRFVWCIKGKCEKAYVKFALKEDYEVNGDFTNTVYGSCEKFDYGKDYSSCKVRLDGLVAGKIYVYTIGCDSEVSGEVYEFQTISDANEEKTFNIVGDVHMKARNFKSAESAFPREKIRHWDTLLTRMTDYDPHISFVLSAGDNVSASNVGKPIDTERLFYYGMEEHKMLFTPKLMKSIPFATVLGNHDTPEKPEDNEATIIKYFYDLPNDDGFSGHYKGNSIGNMWFRNGDVLIIGINVLAEFNEVTKQCTPEINREYILKALDKNKDAKWKIVVTHIPPYSYLGRPESREPMQECFKKMLVGVDIDVVFTAHSHGFSRSYHIKDGRVVENEIMTESDEENIQNAYVVKPEGTVYYNVPAGMNHSFSYVYPKFKEYIAAWGVNGEEVIGMEEFNGVAYNSFMFTNVSVYKKDEHNAMTIKVVRSDNLESIDTYTIYK